ncbi:hypothetical protein ACSSS7_006433 [Eimeria intestinalis]
MEGEMMWSWQGSALDEIAGFWGPLFRHQDVACSAGSLVRGSAVAATEPPGKHLQQQLLPRQKQRKRQQQQQQLLLQSEQREQQKHYL